MRKTIRCDRSARAEPGADVRGRSGDAAASSRGKSCRSTAADRTFRLKDHDGRGTATIKVTSQHALRGHRRVRGDQTGLKRVEAKVEAGERRLGRHEDRAVRYDDDDAVDDPRRRRRRTAANATAAAAAATTTSGDHDAPAARQRRRLRRHAVSDRPTNVARSGRLSGAVGVARPCPASSALDLHRLDRVPGLEAEDLRVEDELGLQARHDRLRLAEAVLLALERQVGVRARRSPRSAATIVSACAGGTTSSSSPWNRITGPCSRSAKWIGERARYRSAASGYGPDQPVEVARLELVRVARRASRRRATP